MRSRLEDEIEPRAGEPGAPVRAVHGGDTIVRLVERYDAAIVGGGIIGLASAWRAQQRGLRVCVLERGAQAAGRRAQPRACSGPIRRRPASPRSPVLRRSYGRHSPVSSTTRAVYALRIARPLVRGGHRRTPWRMARRRGVPSARARHRVGLPRRLAPAEDAQVDPRRVVDALVSKIGDALRTHADVVDLTPRSVELADGSRIEADRVVLAAGAWSARRLAEASAHTAREGSDPAPPRTAARDAHHPERGGLRRPARERRDGARRNGRGRRLRRRADRRRHRVAFPPGDPGRPRRPELEVVEVTASLRPGTPDNGPLIGEWEGLLIAGGHYRNGILLAPITAEAIAAFLAGEEPPSETAAFDPRRFEV